MWHWIDILYYLKWYLIIVQIFIIFLTALLLSSQKFARGLKGKKLMLITAHPDDEVMFFTPFLNYFQDHQKVLVCLSKGNSAGLGKIREKELEQASKFLKISQLELIDNSKLEDGLDKDWDLAEIVKIITNSIEKYSPDAIFTFDHGGVSHHPNHVAIRSAFDIYKKNSKSENIEFWELESTKIIRKYIGIFDLVFSGLKSDVVFNPNPILVWKAMAIHNSQFVWYRKLFVIFSRFAYLNNFKKF